MKTYVCFDARLLRRMSSIMKCPQDEKPRFVGLIRLHMPIRAVQPSAEPRKASARVNPHLLRRREIPHGTSVSTIAVLPSV
jgi:hypothetical protein